LAFSLSFKPHSAKNAECNYIVFDEARPSSLDSSDELVNDLSTVPVVDDEEPMHDEAAQYKLHGCPFRSVSRLPAWLPVFFARPQRRLSSL